MNFPRPKTDLSKSLLLVILIPVALAVTLVPYSLLIGWNLFSLVLFWFVIVPVIVLNLPATMEAKWMIAAGRVTGLLFFYGAMHFMIYDHSQTDYYKGMMLSGGVNLAITLFLSLDGHRLIAQRGTE